MTDSRLSSPEMSLSPPGGDALALVLGGGGARGAYQAGVLRGIARQFPDLRFPILCGISAGAVNTVHLANHAGPLNRTTEDLVQLWMKLSPDQVFEVRALPLVKNMLRWGFSLVAGGMARRQPTRGLVDTDPLRQFLAKALDHAPDEPLEGIQRNIDSGKLIAVALAATRYATGQSVTWVQGREVDLWTRPQRHAVKTHITVDHIMASSALPLLFPAVSVGDEWFGDGGVRLTAPLSPALHLGASRILTISTRYARSVEEASKASAEGYPSPAQVLGTLYNAIFLDLIDEDILRLNMVNGLLARLPKEQHGKMRRIENLVIRPSEDLGKIARKFEPRLPGFFRYLTRGLGTRSGRSYDMVSLILFQEDYIRHLIELGEADAARESERIGAFFDSEVGRGIAREA